MVVVVVGSHYAQDALLDATHVVGPRNTLALIWETAGRDSQQYASDPKKNWHALEADLYCVRSIARMVERDETDILPKVMAILPQIGSGPGGLRYTATLIVARYADWLNHHPQYIESLMKFVVNGLKEKEVVSSAALAFKHVCDGCAVHVAKAYLEPCFSVYGGTKPFALQDQKEVIEGMCCVICTLPAGEKLTGALHRLLTPIVSELNSIVGTNVDSQTVKERTYSYYL